MISLQLVFLRSSGSGVAELEQRSWSSGVGAAELQCVERNAARYSAWQALHLSLTFSKLFDANPAWHIAAHHAAFSTDFRQVQFARCN